MAFAWIGWIVLILVFATVEMLTLTFVFLMLAFGALGGLVADLVGAPWWLQLLVAAVVSVLLLFGLRPPLLRRLHRGGDTARSNVDALIGMTGTAIETVGVRGGQSKLANGEVWTSRVGADGAIVAPGRPVRVIAIDGATAVVEPVEGNEI